MPMPKNKDRFPELREVLNSALESQNGVRVPYPTLRQAEGIRLRIQTVIGDSRRESKNMFDVDDPKWGRSPYDALDVALDRPYTKGAPDAEEPAYLIVRILNGIYLQALNIKIEDL